MAKRMMKQREHDRTIPVRIDYSCERGKRGYASKAEARKARDSMDTRGRRKGKLRAYECQHCALWHLTSQSWGEHVKQSERINNEKRGIDA